MIILGSLLSCISAVLSLVASAYFMKKYGDSYLMYIVPSICIGLAIFLAFISGELYGIERYKKAIDDAMNKQIEVIVAEMNKIDAEYKAEASARSMQGKGH